MGLKAVVGAILDRLFPSRTAADQRASDLAKDNVILQKELNDATDRPSDSDVAKRLRDGKF